MKCKLYLVCCYYKVEKHDGKEHCVPSGTFYFNYCSSDVNKLLSNLVDLVSNLGYHYFDVVYMSDGNPIKVYSSVSTILPF